jgi:hypothetical protein
MARLREPLLAVWRKVLGPANILLQAASETPGRPVWRTNLRSRSARNFASTSSSTTRSLSLSLTLAARLASRPYFVQPQMN